LSIRLGESGYFAVENADDKKLFLDLGPAAPNEGRLAALAFHPSFFTNRKYYLLERVTRDGKMFVTVDERHVSEDGLRDSGREPRLILEVPQTTGAHFGGWVEFGPDGFLYISFGDSGPQEDPNGNAQNRTILLGKIARIDVDRQEGDKPYAIPNDNPFVGDPGTLPEIWALGFRAPWRLSFDRVTGDLWVGDVGQDRYEEVDIVKRGENHGWNAYEGFEAFSNRYRRKTESYTPPIFAYGRKYGPSVTGGFVYRADPHSSFYGKYIFGDYESRRIFALTQQDRTLKEIRQIGIAPQRIVSFGQDLEGGIYVVGYEGILYKIDFSAARFE
jgi:glucose/arabinose dehydrogenase